MSEKRSKAFAWPREQVYQPKARGEKAQGKTQGGTRKAARGSARLKTLELECARLTRENEDLRANLADKREIVVRLRKRSAQMTRAYYTLAQSTLSFRLARAATSTAQALMRPLERLVSFLFDLEWKLMAIPPTPKPEPQEQTTAPAVPEGVPVEAEQSPVVSST